MHKRLGTFVAGPENGLDKLTLVTDTLVCYQGGGYDGCFWEWNYAFLDKTGKFHDLMSSGRNGCETEEALIANMGDAKYGEYELIPMSNIKKFIDEYATISVQEVIRKLNTEHGFSISLYCCECGQEFTDMDDIITEHKSDIFHCTSCYYNNEDEEDGI